MDSKALQRRQESEMAFHDRKHSGKKHKDYYDLGVTNIIFDRVMEKIGDIVGKKALDFGCGTGWQTKVLASKGAEVWAFDISGEAVERTKDLMKSLNLLDRIHVDKMPAEKLKYEDNEFDIVLGNSILHHLDLDLTTKEIHRVLNKGGKAYFLEPLGHNPVINLYRKLTPKLRTQDEKPLRFEDFSLFRTRFYRFEHEEYYFLTLFAFLWYFLIRKFFSWTF